MRYRSTVPTGYINIKYAGAPDTNLTLDGTLPPHPIWNDTHPTVDIENNLFTKNPDSFDDINILSAEPASIRRIIVVGNQAIDESLGLLRWAANNVTMTMPKTPTIVSAYDTVRGDDTASWPDTQVTGTVVVPDLTPTPWNYTETVQDSVGTYNGDRGPSYPPLIEGEVVEVILQSTWALNEVAEMHSWHLHRHSFYVVGFGFGTFNEGTDPESFNLDNPVRQYTV